MSQLQQAAAQSKRPKAKPASKPGAWDTPERQAHATKKGPGRKAATSHRAKAPRTAVAPQPLKKLLANVGRIPNSTERRVWRAGEPVHIVKPVRAARAAAARDASS